VLKPLGIPVKVNLPSVGEGIVDQYYSGVSYELKNQSIVTLDSRGDPEFLAAALAEYEAKKTGLLTIGVSAFALAPLQFLTSDADKLIAAQAERIKNSNVSDNVKALWDIQVNQLQNPHKYGLIELVAFPGFLTWKCAYIYGYHQCTSLFFHFIVSHSYSSRGQETYHVRSWPPDPLLAWQHTHLFYQLHYSTRYQPQLPSRGLRLGGSRCSLEVFPQDSSDWRLRRNRRSRG